MADNNPTPPDSVPPTDPSQRPPGPPPAPRKKRRGWWWKIPVALLVLLLILIALAPTIASTGAVRNFVVGRVNSGLNGHVQVSSWSVGWNSPIDVTNVQVYDRNNVLVLTINKLRTQLTLLNALRGNYALGDTLVDLDVNRLVVDEHGNTNLQDLAKPSAPSEAPSSAPAPAAEQPSAPSKVPNVSGTITVNYRGTIEGEGVPQTVYIDPSSAVLKITDINHPIENAIKLAYRVGTAAPSTVDLSGTLAAIESNAACSMDKLAANQKLALSNVDLAAIAPFLKKSDPTAQLAGIANGNLSIDMAGAEKLNTNGQIVVANLVYGGAVLKGDTYRTSTLTLPINITRQAQGNLTVLNITNLGAQFDQGQIAITGTVPQEALDNLKDNKAPGAPGTLKASVQIPKLADLANQLPHLFAVQQGVKLTQGSFTNDTTVTFTEQGVTLASPFQLTGLTATKGNTPVGPLQPVTGTLQATSLPDGKSMTNLRDIAVQLKSSFATIDGSGPSIANVTLKGNYDLRALRQDLGQLFDLSMFQDGRGQFTLTTQGDPTQNGPLTVNLNLDGSNLLLQSKAPSTVTELAGASINLTAAALYDRATSTLTLNRQSPLHLTAQNLSMRKNGQTVMQNLPLDVSAAGVIKTPKDATEVALSDLSVKAGENLLSLQKSGNGDLTLRMLPDGRIQQPNVNVQFSSDLAALNQIVQAFSGKQIAVRGGPAAGELRSGLLNGTIALLPAQQAGYNDLQANLTASNLSVTTYEQPITNEQVTIGLHATVRDDMSNLSANANVNSSFASVQVTNTQVMLKNGTQSVALLDMVPKAHIEANVADLAKAQALSRAFAPPAPSAPAAASPAASPAPAAPAPAPVSGSQVIGRSPGSEIIGRPAPGTPAPAAASMAPESAVASANAPMNVTSGALKTVTDLSRQGQTTTVTQQLTLTNLAFRKGEGTYTSPSNQPTTLNLTATLDTVPSAAAAASLLQQIQKLTIATLDGQFDAGTIKLTKPIVIGDLPALMQSLSAAQPGQSAGQTLNIGGSFDINGSLANATTVLAALQGKPAAQALPVTGEYKLSPTLSAQGSSVHVTAPLSVSAFRVYKAVEQKDKPVFSEDQVSGDVDILYDTSAKNLTLSKVGLNMPTSHALQVAVSGQILGVGAEQQFKDVQVRMTPDLAKVWTILYPMLTPEQQKSLEGLQLVGTQEQTVTLNGSFPSDRPFAEAIQKLTGQAALHVAKAEWPNEGISLANLNLPVALQNGVATVLAPQAGAAPPASGPVTAQFNEGSIDFTGVALDLRYPMPHLSIPANTKLIRNVQTNKLIAQSAFSGASPLFLDTQDMTGVMNLTSVECRELPLAWLVSGEPHNAASGSAAPPAGSPGAQPGRAEFTFSIVPIILESKLMAELRKIGGKSGGIKGNITNGRVVIENGKTFSYVPLVVDKNTIVVQGSVRLADRYIDSMEMQIPKAFISQTVVSQTILGSIPVVSQRVNTEAAFRGLPDPIRVPYSGPVDSFDLLSSLGRIVAANLPQNPLQALPGLLGGQGNQNQNPAAPSGGNPAAPPASQPNKANQGQGQQQQPSDILGGLLQDLTKKKDKKK